MLKEILKERDLLPILKMNDGSVVTVENWRERRAEMLDDLQKYSYGYTPDCLGEGTGEVIFEDKIAYAGKVTEQHINITFNTPNGPFTFYSELYSKRCRKTTCIFKSCISSRTGPLFTY